MNEATHARDVPLAVPLGYGFPLGPLGRARHVRDCLVAGYSPELYYEEMVSWRAFGRSYLFVSRAEIIRHVLLDNARNYQKGPFYRALIQPALGRGSFASEGAIWQRHRQVVAPMFQPRTITHFVPAMVAETRQTIDDWRRKGDGAIVDLGIGMPRLTFSILLATVFSTEVPRNFAPVEASFAKYLRDIRPGLAEWLGLDRFIPAVSRARRRGRKAFLALDRFIEGAVAARVGAPPRDDLLGRLVAACNDPALPFSMEDVRDEVATIFLAGHETTAQALTWTFYLLSRHPEVEARLRLELEEVLRDRDPAYEDLDRLAYTRAVLQEAMRLYPPVPAFSRQAIADDRLEEVTIPAGTIVGFAPWVLHRHRKL